MFVTVNDMEADIKAWVLRLNIRESTRKSYFLTLRKLARFAGSRGIEDQNAGIEFVTASTCARTRNHYLVAINQYRKSRGLALLPLKTSKVVKHQFNTARISEIFDALVPICKNERDRALIALLRYGGLRISEALNLKVGDVSFPHQQLQVNITVSKTTPRDPLVWRSTKYMRDYLCRLPDHDAGSWLFPSQAGRHLASRTFENWLNRESLALGYKITPHDLRRLCATEMAERFGIRVLMDFFGWNNIQTAQVYIDKARGSATTAILAELGIQKSINLFDVTKCWRCGTANQPNSIHCSTCGELLDKSAIPAREKIDTMDEMSLEKLLVQILIKRKILPPRSG
jgi:integrase